jgi:hypothetical protein
MPTRHRRHAITETPRVKAVLDPLREEVGQDRLDWGELVVLGAEEKMRRIRTAREQGDSLRQAEAQRIRDQRGDIDIAAADEVKQAGWARD